MNLFRKSINHSNKVFVQENTGSNKTFEHSQNVGVAAPTLTPKLAIVELGVLFRLQPQKIGSPLVCNQMGALS